MMMMMMTSLLFVLSSSSSTANDDDDVNDARMMTTTTRESGLRDARAFRTIIAKASNNKTFLSSSNHHYRNEAGVDDDEMVVFEGLSDVSTLQWTSNYIRRLLPKHATLENETWEGAAEFTKHLSWELIDDYSNGMMLLEFNKMPRVRNIDPSLKLFHYGLAKNGVLEKLAECDYENKENGKRNMKVETY